MTQCLVAAEGGQSRRKKDLWRCGMVEDDKCRIILSIGGTSVEWAGRADCGGRAVQSQVSECRVPSSRHHLLAVSQRTVIS